MARTTKRNAPSSVEEVADSFNSTVERFVNSIGKLTTEVAVHMQRQDQLDAGINKLDKQYTLLMEKRDTDYRELNHKIDTVADGIKGHFDSTLEKLKNEYDKDLKELSGKHDEDTKELSNRLGSLEKFRWIVAGAILTCGTLFALVKLVFPLLAQHLAR